MKKRPLGMNGECFYTHHASFTIRFFSFQTNKIHIRQIAADLYRARRKAIEPRQNCDRVALARRDIVKTVKAK